ncbi:hypothetical protein DL764_004582 [Monosporascus ibericus]|uniref:AAA-ATPase-like domain-containing protein n=1 Tax=Monosporascus ibericus TaxID=155417 RepID=A0A4Q4TG34_9PEZI|nr:hypothetical protein DL764_004582 [Monosporascus ibericus]
MSIVPEHIREDVVRIYIRNSFDVQGDARIPQSICRSWNDKRPGVLVMEAPDVSSNTIMPLNCASVYDLVRQPKLIYVFDDRPGNRLEELFAEMLHTFIRRMLALRDIPRFGDIPLVLTPAVADTDDVPTDAGTNRQLIGAFHRVIAALIRACDSGERVVVVIDEMEIIGAHSTHRLSYLAHSFVSGLSAVCGAGRKPAREPQSRCSSASRATRQRCADVREVGALWACSLVG